MSGDPIARDFLRRLDRLCRMRTSYREDLTPAGLKLLDRAIHATFLDCCDHGRRAEAQDLLVRLALAHLTGVSDD